MTQTPSQTWEVSLPQYEGPLDLLLDLVTCDQLRADTLPVSQLTASLLAYIQQAGALDLHLSGEWTLMAATLIHLKSCCLLGKKPEETLEGIELARELIERDELRRVAKFFHQQWHEHGEFAAPDPVVFDADPEQPAGGPLAVLPLNALDIAALARQALSAVEAAGTLDLCPPAVRIEEMLSLLEDRLQALSPGERFVFDSLLCELPTDQHRIACLLALLEAARNRGLQIDQSAVFDPIWVFHGNLSMMREEAGP